MPAASLPGLKASVPGIRSYGGMPSRSRIVAQHDALPDMQIGRMNLRLRGGGGGQSGVAPKYASNTHLNREEYTPPFGTVIRSMSGALFSPTPVPAWFEEGTMYQIYPLGSPGGKPGQGGGFFGDVPAENDGTSRPTDSLLRIREYYEHFQKLGVTAIYFSPIFESETHGYDTVDYYMIDRRVGSLNDFKAIVQELHEIGIKVILDGVFNHTGRKFFAFKDIMEKGEKWQTSQYKDWYFIAEGNSTYGDKFAYRSWEGHEEIPELNVENEEVRKYLFDVGKFWLTEVGVDGWRLDVAHELPPSFWRDFRTACTEANPEHILLGEVIHGDYNTWVGPNKGLLHSGTNYQLSKALWSSLKEKNFYELEHSFARDAALYREMSLVNFLSNHDVARVATLLKDDHMYAYLAHFLLFTVRGIPCIYYGDELMVEGVKEESDAALRCTMPSPDPTTWSGQAADLVSKVSALSALRTENPALTWGNLNCMYVKNQELVFSRSCDTPRRQMLFVAVNSGLEHQHVELENLGNNGLYPGVKIRNVYGDGADCGAVSEDYKLRIHIPPTSGRILEAVFFEEEEEETPAEGEAPAEAPPS